jgi:CheY-like chemotaxis protein
MHGGTIRAESGGAGRGTKFTVTLPVAARLESPPPLEHGAPSRAVEVNGLPRLDGVRVLVVDDEPNTCRIVTTLLAQYGAEARGSGSAAEAREVLAAWRPDVLISDIGMPGEDGYEFLRQLRAGGPEYNRLPAVALTAYSRLEDRMRSLRAGFQMHVTKPVEPAELVAVVASLVHRTGKPAADRDAGEG